jgi:chromosome segregation ATPase
MKPLPLAAAAFAAGLIPGLALYWTSARSAAPTPQSLAAPVPTVAAPVAPPPVASTAVPPAAVEKKDKPVAPTLQNIALLEQQLRDRAERLTTAEASLTETKSRLTELEAKIAALTEQSAQAQAAEKSLRQELDAAGRQIATLQGDLKARDAKPVEDTAQIRALKQAADTAQRSAARTTELANELEEISRRRETYLNQILSRYREATDLFRAMSVRMDNPRDAGSPLNNDLSRIQQAVQHAEEDLRQLRALNQGSTRVMKELAAGRVKK